LRELEKYKFQSKALELTLNGKEENSSDFCLVFAQKFGLWANFSIMME
jgi:hypothetical protein